MKANRKTLLKNDEQAQVGIGTLIIFIAMVLVAAVAAAVLIQTSGTLQQKAQSTGEEAIQEVSGNLMVKTIEGIRDDTASTTNITQLEIQTALSAGADNMDFEQLIITITDGSESNTLNFTQIGTEAIRDADSSYTKNNVTNQNDLIKITLDATDLTGLTLDPRTDVKIVITPEAGIPVNIELTTPATYGLDKVISLV